MSDWFNDLVPRPVIAVADFLASATVASYLFGFLHQLPIVFAGLASALSAAWYAWCLYEAIHSRKSKVKRRRSD